MDDKEFTDVVKNYVGEIKKVGCEIWIENENEICCYYKTGEVCRKSKTMCKVGLYNNDKLFTEEKTCEIIGGMYGQEATTQNLIDCLKKYNFAKKKCEQLKLC